MLCTQLWHHKLTGSSFDLLGWEHSSSESSTLRIYNSKHTVYTSSTFGSNFNSAVWRIFFYGVQKMDQNTSQVVRIQDFLKNIFFKKLTLLRLGLTISSEASSSFCTIWHRLIIMYWLCSKLTKKLATYIMDLVIQTHNLKVLDTSLKLFGNN